MKESTNFAVQNPRPSALWIVLSKKKGKNREPGPPVHDDLVTRVLNADAPNKLWLTDTTEHKGSRPFIRGWFRVSGYPETRGKTGTIRGIIVQFQA
jgi:hypothetical protein